MLPVAWRQLIQDRVFHAFHRYESPTSYRDYGFEAPRSVCGFKNKARDPEGPRLPPIPENNEPPKAKRCIRCVLLLQGEKLRDKFR